MIGAGFGLLFALALHAVERRGDPTLPRARPAWLLRAGLAGLLAFGAGSAVIVPARLLSGSTARSATLTREVAEHCSLHPLRLVEFVAPQSMGDAYGHYPAAPIVGEPTIDGLPLSYSMYMGASVVALLLAALGRRRRLALALALLLFAALLLAFGKHTPLHAVFRRIVFPLAYMRYPEKYMVLVVATLALLAGLGAARVLGAEPQPWRRNALLFAGLAAFGVLAYLVLPPVWMVFAVRGALLGALAVLGILAVQFLAARGSAIAPYLLVAVVALDLANAAWPLQGFGGRRLASEPPAAARLVRKLRHDPAAPPRIYRSHLTTGAVNRWVVANTNTEGELRLVSTLITNTVNAWGIATLPGYDAAIPALVERVWDKGLDVGQSALRLLGAEFAILPVTDFTAGPNDRPGLEAVLDPLPGARMYRVPGALPRVFLARHAEVLADEDALARIYRRETIAGESVWLAPDEAARPRPLPPGRAGECRLLSYENRRLSAECSASEPAVAVFVEQYDRGWRATLDGRPVPLLRANLIMRAVAIDPGKHQIVLAYHIPGLRLGAALSGICLFILAGLWLWGRKE
jgi:hypothetical protein